MPGVACNPMARMRQSRSTNSQARCFDMAEAKLLRSILKLPPERGLSCPQQLPVEEQAANKPEPSPGSQSTQWWQRQDARKPLILVCDRFATVRSHATLQG